jgi:cation:H+ antiporter
MTLFLAILGFILLVGGAELLVRGSVRLAAAAGISPLVVGLTVVALGTSAPELAVGIQSARAGQGDLTLGNVVGSNISNVLLILGNVVGSNILNIFGVLGASAVVAPAGIAVNPGALRLDIPVMIAASVACLPIFFRGYRIVRWEAALLLGHYIAYVTYLVLRATGHAVLGHYTWFMLAFALPLTTITLIVILVREFRANRVRPKEPAL